MAVTTTTAQARLRASRAPSATTIHPGPCGGWEPLVATFTDWNVADVCSVLWCESRGDPNARNGRYHSLMQVGGGSFDPATNIAQAHAMWLRRGWQPWECRP